MSRGCEILSRNLPSRPHPVTGVSRGDHQLLICLICLIGIMKAATKVMCLQDLAILAWMILQIAINPPLSSLSLPMLLYPDEGIIREQSLLIVLEVIMQITQHVHLITAHARAYGDRRQGEHFGKNCTGTYFLLQCVPHFNIRVSVSVLVPNVVLHLHLINRSSFSRKTDEKRQSLENLAFLWKETGRYAIPYPQTTVSNVSIH